MLDLNRTNQREDYEKLLKAFEGLDVYIYLKSEDSQWYRKIKTLIFTAKSVIIIYGYYIIMYIVVICKWVLQQNGFATRCSTQTT